MFCLWQHTEGAEEDWHFRRGRKFFSAYKVRSKDDGHLGPLQPFFSGGVRSERGAHWDLSGGLHPPCPPMPTNVANSILLCWIFAIKDQSKKVCFYKHIMKVFISCFWQYLCLARHTWRECPCISEVLEASQEARLRAIEGCPVSSKSPSRVREKPF